MTDCFASSCPRRRIRFRVAARSCKDAPNTGRYVLRFPEQHRQGLVEEALLCRSVLLYREHVPRCEDEASRPRCVLLLLQH